MGFWGKLGSGLLKVAPIAAYAAAPFTAGASLAALPAIKGVQSAVAAKKAGAGLGASLLSGAGSYMGQSIANHVAGPYDTQGSKMTGLLSGLQKGMGSNSGGVAGPLGAVGGTLSNTGNALAYNTVQNGAVRGSMADQAAMNRRAETQAGQAGVAADAGVLTNMNRAGHYADYTPVSPLVQAQFDKYGKRIIGPNDKTREFSSTFQDEIRKRQLAGQPMTMSGMIAPGAQENEDNFAAREAAFAPTQGLPGVLNKAGTATTAGANLASLIPQFQDIYESFKKPAINTAKKDPSQDEYGDYL